MSDPITGAVASAVANRSVSKIVEYIEQSGDGEATWKESGKQLAIKIKTIYTQNKNAKVSDDKAFSRELERYGKFATELSVRGQARGFDGEYCDLLESLGEIITNLARGPNTSDETMVDKYENKNVGSLVDEMLEYG
jgi:hypothetical protein